MNKLTDAEIFTNEILCIRRRATGICNGGTDCNTCDLLMNEVEIIEAYQRAMKHNDLINRQKAEKQAMLDYIRCLEEENKKQKAEIERLNKEVDRLSLCVLYHDGQIADAKAEAIKEFAEKLKENAIDVDVSYGYGKEHYTEAVAVIEIDNLVIEMTKQTTLTKIEHNSLCETETYKGGE